MIHSQLEHWSSSVESVGPSRVAAGLVWAHIVVRDFDLLCELLGIPSQGELATRIHFPEDDVSDGGSTRLPRICTTMQPRVYIRSSEGIVLLATHEGGGEVRGRDRCGAMRDDSHPTHMMAPTPALAFAFDMSSGPPPITTSTTGTFALPQQRPAQQLKKQ